MLKPMLTFVASPQKYQLTVLQQCGHRQGCLSTGRAGTAPRVELVVREAIAPQCIIPVDQSVQHGEHHCLLARGNPTRVGIGQIGDAEDAAVIDRDGAEAG